MNIVIEGPDNSGKSTLARSISSELGWPVKSSEGPEKYPGEINERLIRYLEMDRVIFDRHPCVSQMIYHLFNKTNPVPSSTIKDFYASSPVIIYCPGMDLDDHTLKDDYDTDEHLEMIERNHSMICRFYDIWALKHAHIIYRKGDPISSIIKFLMPSPIEDIKDFHEKFGLDYDGPPRLLDPQLSSFREDFMEEELREYRWAISDGNLERAFDALLDLKYVLLGTAYLHGLGIDRWTKGWNRVHNANMGKTRAERSTDSKRGSTFDVVKPDGWVAPDLSDLV
jgi:predicted HAD superfamily Cof-like phosphohydrolase